MTDRVIAWRGKWLASGISVLMVGAALRPIVENWRRRPKDSFPLSYYPMFSKQRKPTERVTYLVGIDAQGARRLLPYDCAGAGGLNQVRRQIRKIARQDQAAGELCAAIAARLALRPDDRYADLVTIHLVTGRYRLHEFFAGRREPEWERVHATWRRQRGG